MLEETFEWIPPGNICEAEIAHLVEQLHDFTDSVDMKVGLLEINSKELELMEQALAPFHVNIECSILEYAKVVSVTVWLLDLVSSWSEALPLLEAFGNTFGDIDWDSTDLPETYTRSFIAHFGTVPNHFMLQVYVSLPGDTKDCKRIVLGYEQPYVSEPQLKYKFVCNSDPLPPRDLPF